MSHDPTPDLLFPTCADCASMGAAIPDWLPAMEAALGFDAMRAFLLLHGGQQFVVPVSATTGDPVKDWLRRELGHGRLTLPMGPAAARLRQRWTALGLFRAGRSLSQVAAALNLHTRTAAKYRGDLIRRGLLPRTPTTGTSSR